MIIEYKGKSPRIDRSAFIAPTAVLIGDVVIEAKASVWFGAVIRGDHGQIVIGSRTNVQDNVVIHVNGRHDTVLGNGVTVGHGAVLEGCQLHDEVLIGMNATVLSGAVIEPGSLVAAGSVVGENQQFPAGVLVAGAPARVKGPLSESARQRLTDAPLAYVQYGRSYQMEARLIEPSQ